MAPNGRLVIPAAVRAELGMEGGGAFVLHLQEDGTIHLVPLQRAIRHVQEEMRGYVPAGVSLVDELITERHRAAHDE